MPSITGNPTQRGRTRHLEPPSRPGTGVPAALAVLRTLTDRDRYLLQVLAEHRVLTADQITRLRFGDPNTARKRLVLLTRRGVLDRFRDGVRPGSQAWRYALGPLGATIVAAEQGRPAPRPAVHAEQVLRLARSPRLNHLLGVNDFFVALAHHARHEPAFALRWWLSEARATGLCAGLARPDGVGVWTHQSADGSQREVTFFVEHDEGTEALSRLVAKLAGYAEARLGDGPDHPVLFWLPTLARETHLHGRLAHHPSPILVATATREAATATGTSPAGPVWLIPGHTRRRRLLDLDLGQAATARLGHGRPDATAASGDPFGAGDPGAPEPDVGGLGDSSLGADRAGSDSTDGPWWGQEGSAA